MGIEFKMKSRANIVVTGKVQGVGFRYFVYRQAILMGLKGWVRNSQYNQVEIELEGDKLKIEILIRKAWEGPRFSSVENVKVTWNEFQSQFSSFDITY